jgi:hypothetical protein
MAVPIDEVGASAEWTVATNIYTQEGSENKYS